MSSSHNESMSLSASSGSDAAARQPRARDAPRGIAYVFTLNNPSADNVPESLQPLAKYCIWQAEVGEDGTRHLQGYVYLLRRRRITELKKYMSRAHFEPRRGTHAQARDYAQKEDTRVAGPWSYGTEEGIPQKRGQRTDIKQATEQLSDGVSMRQVAEDLPDVYVKYHRGLESYHQLVCTKHRDPEVEPTIYIYHGPPGTGKTRKAMQEFPDAYWLEKPLQAGNVWFQGYAGETTMVLDEFYGWLPFDFLLRLLDRYPLNLPVKGGHVKCQATTFVFTSNKSWPRWYNPDKCNIAALERRINEFGFVEAFTADE